MRKIIHIDADAFYASVEERDNPELKTVPLAVGGSASGRGVVATCNYIAREYGVRSAMASAQALRLCPSLQFIKPRFPAYREASQAIHVIFKRYTSLIEPLSLDEAYLDVTDSEFFGGSATRIAQAIQSDVLNELQLSVSAGVAPNKFLAKIASDWKKPAGLYVITPEHVDSFVKALPVGKINGVGKVTEKKLHNLGIYTCDDLRKFSAEDLSQRFGKYGLRLSELAYGVDRREVKVERRRKSLSVENTFGEDISTREELIKQTHKQFAELEIRAKKLKSDTLITARYVKVKFKDFSQTTLEETLHVGLEAWENLDAFEAMIVKAWQRKALPVRLIGLGLRISSTKADEHQLDLFAN